MVVDSVCEANGFGEAVSDVIRFPPAIREFADSASDGVDANDVSFDPTFPYLALPYSGSDKSPH